MLLIRVLAALCFTPPLVWCTWRGGLPLQLTLLGLGLLMLWELLQLTLADGPWALRALGLGLGLGYGGSAVSLWPAPSAAAMGLLLVWPGLLAGLVLARAPGLALQRAGTLALGIPYATGSLSFLWPLRNWPERGQAIALMVLLCTWGSDTGAYFAGRRFGRRKLYPAVSPSKTWAGALGGLIAALAVGAALQQVLVGAEGGPWGAGIGAVAAIAGLLGDLSESLLKRAVGAKDSSRLLPGHGGVLDRCDGLLLSAPAVYALLHLCPP